MALPLQFIATAITEGRNISVSIADMQADDTPLIYVNQGFEHLTGYSMAEVVGKNCRFLQGAHTDQTETTFIAEAIRNARPVSVVLKNYRKDGQEFYNHLSLSPIFDESGTLTYYVGVQTDVTEIRQTETALRETNKTLERTVQQRTAELQEFVSELRGELQIQKRLEAQLREMNTMLEARVDERTAELRIALEKQKELGELRARFIMTVSHEFRTPLSGIALAAGIMKRFSNTFSPEDRHEQIDNIRISVQNLTELLDQVIFISQSEANKLDLTPQPIALSAFCKEIIRQIRLIDNDSHRFDFVCSPEDLTIEADEKLMRSVLTNLITNAAKYSPQGSPIQIEFLCDGEYACLQVRDQGIGIPEEDMSNLFEPFHRAGNVQTIQGTGLGLSIVKNAIVQHGGSIDVASTAGVGTVFTIRLPIKQPIA